MPTDEKLLVDNLGRKAFYKRITVYEDSINRWQKGLFFPNEEELKKLKNHQKNFKKGKIDEEYSDRIKETSSEDTKRLIEEERKASKKMERILDDLLENDKYRQQAEVNRIESEFKNRKVRVGEPTCLLGHSNVTAYKHGNRPDQDDFEDTISYVYCSTCGRSDNNPELRNTRTYNFEEWCRMRNQSYANELAEMNQQIQEQERRNQEVIARIRREKTERETNFQRDLEQQKSLQIQIINKQKKIDEERLNREKLAGEGKVISDSQERERKLKRELNEMKQELENQIWQSQIRRDNAQWNLQSFIEQQHK